MTVNDTIQYLRAMEQQLSQFGQCESRMRSIQSSINELKREQASLKPPPRPTYETPHEVSGFADARALGVWLLCFLTVIVVYCRFFLEGANNGDTIPAGIAILLIFLALIPAFIAGKWGAEKRKQDAEAAEAKRVRNVNLQRDTIYNEKKRNVEAKQQEIAGKIKKLNADYERASQAREQARNKVIELGDAIRLHSDYWSSYALSHIRNLLEHGRADTLKEALNRYEDEERQREHRQQMEDYASAQAAAAEAEADYRRQQAEYQAQQAEYARQQANDAAATRSAVEDMKWQQDWDRIDRMFGK